MDSAVTSALTMMAVALPTMFVVILCFMGATIILRKIFGRSNN